MFVFIFLMEFGTGTGNGNLANWRRILNFTQCRREVKFMELFTLANADYTVQQIIIY